MSRGKVEAIYIGPERKGPMRLAATVQAVAGKGLVGDRYWQKGALDTEITLIEGEAIDAAARDEDVTISAAETRRNIVTRGVALNHLVGQEFRIGTVRLRGIRVCEPCGHLEALTRAGVRLALLHRGGLRAQILDGGDLHVGDPVGV